MNRSYRAMNDREGLSGRVRVASKGPPEALGRHLPAEQEQPGDEGLDEVFPRPQRLLTCGSTGSQTLLPLIQRDGEDLV